MSPPPPIGAALYRWRSAPEPTDVRGSRHLVFGPEAPGAIPCRRRSGSHQPPDLWIDVRRVLVPFTARLFVMSAEYVRGRPGASSAGVLRSRRSAGRAGPGSADRPDLSPNAGRAGRPNRGRPRSDGSGCTSRTGRAAGPTTPLRVAPRRSCGHGGEGGIRTHEVFRLSAFQERRHQPLGHLSSGQDIAPFRAAVTQER